MTEFNLLAKKDEKLIELKKLISGTYDIYDFLDYNLIEIFYYDL